MGTHPDMTLDVARLPNLTTTQPIYIFVYLLLFYVRATSKVISGCVPTCHSAHSWKLYNAASLGQQTAGPMICYPTQPHYPDTEPTSPCPIQIMLSGRVLKATIINFYVFGLIRPGFEPAGSGITNLPEQEAGALLTRPPRLVYPCHQGNTTLK